MRAYFKAVAVFAFILLASIASPATGQIGFGSKSASSKQPANDQKANKLLHQHLPLVLDANTALPTVPPQDMLGGPFHGRVLPMTRDTLTKPLPPGDYILPTTFFCSEYSVHRPGAGTAYVLAPAQGTSAKAISTLLWRGMLSGHSPQELQSVSWAIQGSVAYDKMPPKYQALVQELIPDLKNQVNGQAFADIEDGFQGKVNRGIKSVTDPLNRGLGKITAGRAHVDIKFDVELVDSFKDLGRLGQEPLDGQHIAEVITKSFPSDEARERELYAGAGTQAPPLPAAEGPWSVMVPGVAYMRFVVHGGNLQSNNELQIRILPARATAIPERHPGHLVLASYQISPGAIAAGPTVLSLFGFQFDAAVLAACSLVTDGIGDLGPCEVLALKAVGTGLVAYGISAAAGGVQTPTIGPGPLASVGNANNNHGKRGNTPPPPIGPTGTNTAAGTPNPGGNDPCRNNWKDSTENRKVEIPDNNKLQAKFDAHAGDFGVTGPRSKATLAEFANAIRSHVADPNTLERLGTYRGGSVIHFLNPTTGLDVMTTPGGDFISGWRLNGQLNPQNPADGGQLQNVWCRGSL